MQKKPPSQTSIAIDIDPKPLKAFTCDYPIQKINTCAHHYLSEYHYTGSELIYCDPPYLIETRTSKHRYRYEYTRQDHLNLLELFRSLHCNIILSGYPSALYDAKLAGWNSMELQAMTWGGPRTESSDIKYHGQTAWGVLDKLPKNKLIEILYEQWETEEITRIELEQKDKQIAELKEQRVQLQNKMDKEKEEQTIKDINKNANQPSSKKTE